METGLIERVEGAAERGASALFAAAVGYAAYALWGAAGFQAQAGLWAAGAGALAYLPCSRILALAGTTTRGFALPQFLLRDFHFVDAPEELLLTDPLVPDELLLTDRVVSAELVLTAADRVDAEKAAEQGPLVLDDILAEIGPDARVVRLFDRKTMPTPAELQSRIADHLRDGAPSFASSKTPAPSNTRAQSDASQALSAALAELRRSLR